MILRLSITAIVLLSSQLPYNSAAQAVTGSVPKWMVSSMPENRRAAYELYLKHHAGGSLKTTGTSERMTGLYQAQYNSLATITNEDSAWYRYSGTRGINPKGGSMYIGNMRMDMLFDTGISYQWTGIQGSYAPENRVLKSFDAQDRPDSFIYQDWTGSSWANEQKGSYTYTAAGKESIARTEMWDVSSQAWRPSHRTFYSYNSAGDIVSDSFQSWDNGTNAMVNYSRMLYSYDGAGRLNMMTWQTWNATSSNWEPNYKDSIGYTATGKVGSWTSQYFDAGSGSWQNDYRDLSYYNGADFEVAAVRQMGDLSGGWKSMDSTVHAVLNAAGLPLLDTNYFDGGTGWQLSERTTNTYTSSNLLSTSQREKVAAGNLENDLREFYFYDAYGELTRHYDQTWSGTAWSTSYAGEQRYYYEPYTTTGINSARPGTAIQAYLYPVPASATATLALNLPAQQKLKISLYDAAGRLQYSWSELAPAGLYTKDFSVSSLPAGRYSLLVDAGQGYWSGSLVIVR